MLMKFFTKNYQNVPSEEASYNWTKNILKQIKKVIAKVLPIKQLNEKSNNIFIGIVKRYVTKYNVIISNKSSTELWNFF